jgi:hypothetical protein
MDAKEKAEDLIHNIMWNTLISRKKAIICALITVKEIIKSLDYLFGTIKEVTYYEEVKRELEVL